MLDIASDRHEQQMRRLPWKFPILSSQKNLFFSNGYPPRIFHIFSYSSSCLCLISICHLILFLSFLRAETIFVIYYRVMESGGKKCLQAKINSFLHFSKFISIIATWKYATSNTLKWLPLARIQSVGSKGGTLTRHATPLTGPVSLFAQLFPSEQR